ncbi:MAG: preprotein translocase subunit SecG [Ignavibacteria bacterium]|jgi:preprotein translocase subunit SecG|nr:preprotein translocase subunit SecG [Ignavibacteria bacterium]MDH7526920.1 preprotein translocase subunit SecG [Ignavibacteria bacterium]NPV11759.1 preprotein translocase subunit SecG [Ignavibacteria bacterium]
MFTFLLIVSIFLAILLIIVVLMQSSKGGGLAGTFGGPGEMGAIFGVRRTADFLMKTTWVLAVTLMLLAIVINLAALPSSSQEKMRESIIQRKGMQSLPQRPALPPTQSTQPQQNK